MQQCRATRPGAQTGMLQVGRLQRMNPVTNPTALATPWATAWSTASFSDGDGPHTGHLSDLAAHLGRCRRVHGRMHFVRAAGHGTGVFFLGHIVTCLMLLLLLCGLLTMVL